MRCHLNLTRAWSQVIISYHPARQAPWAVSRVNGVMTNNNTALDGLANENLPYPNELMTLNTNIYSNNEGHNCQDLQHCFPVVSKLVWFREHIDSSRESYAYGEVVKLIEE